MMIAQHALHIGCNDGQHDLVELEAPYFVGPVEYGWANRDDDDPTVFGVGPLAGTHIPGANALVAAARSPLWDGFHTTSLPGGGLALAELGPTLLAFRGRAAEPSVLIITRTARDTCETRLEALDPEPLWRGTPDGDGVFALQQHLLHKHQDRLSSLQVLATGPAAASTRFGCLCSSYYQPGKAPPPLGWLRRGGLGSRLYQVHRLCAVVIGCERGATPLESHNPRGDVSLDGLRPAPALEELERAVHYQFNPRLRTWGTLGASLAAVRQRLLWFNGSSIYLSGEERDELYLHGTRDQLLGQIIPMMGPREAHCSCGERCPVQCQSVVDGRLRELEPHLALGPQLGVLDPTAIDQVARHCETLGFDSLSIGACVGWLMERLHRQEVQPSHVGATGVPHWSARDFAPLADSQHNARLARELVDGVLFAGWSQSLRQGLRSGARATGGPAAAFAIYNANGETGEMPNAPYWTPGYYTPMPIAGEHLQYYGIDFVPPRVLGRKSAQRMSAELQLQNFGFCRLHRGWCEELAPDLVNRRDRTATDWVAHHRDLAKRIFQRRKARFWESSRIVDIVASYLQDYQHDAAPDDEVDRWVRRFREDKASAARAYWSEVNAGLEEILGS